MTTPTLLDDVLPEFDVRSRHNWLVSASPDAAWRALETYDVRRDSSPLVRALFLLRGLSLPHGTVRQFVVASGFTVLAERPGEEIVVGTAGRFWALKERSNMEAPADLDAFRAFRRPGWAKAAMTMRVEPREQGWSKLCTETRVQCIDEVAKHRFAAYWRLIEVFSGWIRQDMLRAVARLAEEAA